MRSRSKRSPGPFGRPPQPRRDRARQMWAHTITVGSGLRLGMTHDRGHPARHGQSHGRPQPRRSVDVGAGGRSDVLGGLRPRHVDAGCGGWCRRRQHLRPASDPPAQRPHNRSVRRHHHAMGHNLHPHSATGDRSARNRGGRRCDAGRAGPGHQLPDRPSSRHHRAAHRRGGGGNRGRGVGRRRRTNHRCADRSSTGRADYRIPNRIRRSISSTCRRHRAVREPRRSWPRARVHSCTP